jgi:hypothetical protein
MPARAAWRWAPTHSDPGRFPGRHARGAGRTAECAPLMIGGSDSTVRRASRTTGYTSARWISGTNLPSFVSLSR